MKLPEDEAKEILREYGISVPESEIAGSVLEAQKIVGKLKYPVMIKALIGFGGRGKGHIIGSNLSGVEQANTSEQAYKIVSEMLGKYLITAQTPDKGVIINQVLIEEKISDIIQEFYLSVSILDGLPVIMVSKHGGVNIEKVDNGQIIKEPISSLYGVDDVQRNSLKRALAHKLKMDDLIISPLTEIALKLYQLFGDNDCTLIELNPFGLRKNGEDYEFVAMDAKMKIDDNAMSRHTEFQFLIDEISDPLERRAKQCKLGYVHIDGDIACMGNGAGITMACRDEIFENGGSPGNFLDLGGGATSEQIKCALEILCSDIRTKVIFINIFSGIFKLDVFAKILVDFMTKNDKKIPIVLRLEGLNVEKAKELLDESRITYFICESMEQGVEKAVELSKEYPR